MRLLRPVHLVRKVVRSARYYMITLPRPLGELLHGETVLVTIEPLENAIENEQ